MGLSQLQRAAIERQLKVYCGPIPRPEVARVLRYGFQIVSSGVCSASLAI